MVEQQLNETIFNQSFSGVGGSSTTNNDRYSSVANHHHGGSNSAVAYNKRKQQVTSINELLEVAETLR